MKYLSVTILCLISTVVYSQNYIHPSLRKSDPSLKNDPGSGLESVKQYGEFLHPSTQPAKNTGRTTDINLEKDIKNLNSTQMQVLQHQAQREFLILETPKEISLKEYRQAKKALYRKMRASEPVYKRSGYWLDLSYEAGNFTREPLESRLQNELIILRNREYFDFSQAITLSMGKVIKGFMIGGSFHYRFSRSWFEKREGYTIHKGHIPASYGFAGVLGYRVAPDNGVGMRLMLHAGYGFSPENLTDSKGQQYQYHYVMITPEYKMDIKLVSALVWTIGIAYQFNILLSNPPSVLTENPSAQNGFNFSTGLALSY